jgi:hypothetical protein
VLHLSQAVIADQEEFQDQLKLASVDVRCRKRCRIGIQLMIIFNNNNNKKLVLAGRKMQRYRQA